MKTRLEDYITVDLRGAGSEDMNRVKLVQDRVQVRIHPAVVLNICVPGIVRNFLKMLMYNGWQRQTLKSYPVTGSGGP
jgi:hypothetical protein